VQVERQKKIVENTVIRSPIRGGVLATIIVENREYAVSLDSLEKTGKNRKSSTSKETTT